jgi:replicative DNA helicase
MMNEQPLYTLEAQVVGAVLANPSFYSQAAFLPEDAFSDTTNANIWGLVTKSHNSGDPYTPAALSIRFSSQIEPLGGLAFLNRLAALGEQITSVFPNAVDRLHEELQWKRIATISARLNAAVSSREKSPSDVLSGLSTLTKQHLSGGRDTTQSKSGVARGALAAAQQPRDITITGLESVDLMMQGGLQSKRLYGIGGLFGRGKTILLGSISDNLNMQSVPHLFCSLETPPEDIELRSCAKHLNINVSSIHDQGQADYQTFVASAEEYLAAMPDYVHYDYSPQATIDEIHRKVLSAKSRHGIKGFIVDYWQLIRGQPKGISLERHLDDCADRLAAICRQEDLWGIVSAQVDEQGRLKYSNALYQSASLYIRLVRDEDESASYFVTEKSNYTPYLDQSGENVASMIFDSDVGPHFRDSTATDVPSMAAESDDKIEV